MAVTRPKGVTDAQALTPTGTFVRFDAEGKPPVTDGPFAETKDLIAGWYAIDVGSEARAHEVAAFVSSEPGPGGRPCRSGSRSAPSWRTPRVWDL